MGIYRTNAELLRDFDDDEIKSYNRLGDAIMRIELVDGTVVIQQHFTSIVTIYPNGDVELDSGGHYPDAATTKKLMNRYAPGVSVSQTNFVWYVSTPELVMEYEDGVIFDKKGLLAPRWIAKLYDSKKMTTTEFLEFLVDQLSDKDIAELVVNGDISRKTFHSLPPEVQVAVDVELEKMESE